MIVRSRRAEPAPQLVDVARHQRPDVRVDHRRRRALVLLLLAEDLRRERHGDARQLLAEDRAEPLLVRRMEVRVQQADRDRLDARVAQLPGDRARVGVVERCAHGAVREHALATSKRSRRSTSGGGFVQK